MAKTKTDVAVVIHLYYEDQWPEFQEKLKNLPGDFTLYVTTNPESRIHDVIHKTHPEAIVQPVPNLGRDVAPFLALLPRLAAHDVVCKVHTKRSSGTHTAWRQSLVDGLLGSRDAVGAYLDAFAAEPDLVLAGPRDYYLDGPSHEGASKRALALQHGMPQGHYGFFGGTMFWCRPSAFVQLESDYPQACFEAHFDNDGQPEHVVERAFGLIASQSDKKIMLWDGKANIAKARVVRGDTDFGAVIAKLEKDDQNARPLAVGTRPSLYELHRQHDGFVSDKWTGNLVHYERLLQDRRDTDIRLLEIGVQNGGSLQIWTKYFENGRAFVGCDIDPRCGKLKYTDPRVSVIVADAGATIAKTSAMRICGQFDLIIDDGSHMSRDIIRAFLSFLPALAEDGLFVVEDMACSFWKEFDGGLDLRTSSLDFFKEITNVINREHWQEDASVQSRFARFEDAYDLSIDPQILSTIQSVEILNSMVVIRKGNLTQTTLGKRTVQGRKASIAKLSLLVDGSESVPPGKEATTVTTQSIREPDDAISISVVIPFYNGSAMLPDAVESVHLQSFPAREVIVVNDGSDPEETQWVETFAKDKGLRLITQQNTGQGGARNAGVQAALGTHVCLLDQDDAFLPDHNRALLEHWRAVAPAKPNLGWVFADLILADQNLNTVSENLFPYGALPVLENPPDFISRNAFMWPSATLISKRKFLEVGGFDQRLRGYEDDDLWLRMLLAGSEVSYCPATVFKWREHPRQTSRQRMFIDSAEAFFDKWFGYDWGSSEVSEMTDARLSARMIGSLHEHLGREDKTYSDLLWALLRKVRTAESPVRRDTALVKPALSASKSEDRP